MVRICNSSSSGTIDQCSGLLFTTASDSGSQQCRSPSSPGVATNGTLEPNKTVCMYDCMSATDQDHFSAVAPFKSAPRLWTAAYRVGRAVSALLAVPRRHDLDQRARACVRLILLLYRCCRHSIGSVASELKPVQGRVAG
ncbi:hypothetical protein CEXT_499941 [Caerostris extrusa]|uniref:Uncharacterized protein n=1 Tax=Caerostris extrusa TaxID=172846 RepID=A0AAV4U2S5_CAEEX|nr:hypothetical protein CEXT_499941 [Caerostris extrusa]